MSVDFSATPNNNPVTGESDSPMFAPVPAWERGRKRRGGKSALREDRSFAARDNEAPLRREPLTGDAPTDAYAPIAASDTAFAATPTYAASTARKSNNMAPMAIGAGVIILAGLAAAGWYVSQPRPASGVAELTPGSTSTTTTTTAPAAATPTPDASTAVNPPPGSVRTSSAVPPAATSSTTTTRTTHAKAPASRSVEDAGANAAATLPAAPMPYSEVNPSAAATATPAPSPAATAPAAPVASVPETTPAPPPAPVEATPAPTTQAAPDVTTTAPPEPQAAAPAQAPTPATPPQ